MVFLYFSDICPRANRLMRDDFPTMPFPTTRIFIVSSVSMVYLQR